MLKTGAINGLSIGYIPIEYDVDHKSGARVLKQVELWEVSLVTFPANLAAQVDYETNVKQKYSWSTVFSWLFLKTIGRILPKKWNKWAEDILYCDKATESNEIRTDKTTDESAQIDLKPEVAEKESQSEVISKDGEVQTNKITFHDIAMQTECVETTDKNSDQAQQIADLQSENGLLEVKIEELRSIIVRLKADLQSKNSLLEKENREWRSIIERLKKDYRELVEVTDKQEKEFLVKLKAKSEMIECQGRELTELRAEFTDKINELLERVGEVRKINNLMRLNEGLDEDKKEMDAKVEDLRKHLQRAQESKQQLEKERIDLESKLKDLSSQLSAAEVEKKSSENEVSKLQKQVQILEESKEWELAGIGDTLNKTSLSVMELLAQQLPLNNQEQQNLEKELKNVDKKLESINKKTKEQTEAKAPDTVSTVSTAKSTTESTLSKLRNLPNKLSRDKDLNNFLSRKNKELKKGFPEFKEKHFCHNVLNETIKSLSNQDDGKFESSKLLELLESNLKQSAREIIEAKVKEVVNEHYNIGKNVGKELQDGMLKAKLSPSVRKCVKELELNKQKEGVNKIVNSILHSFNSENNNNNDSVELLKEIVVKELVEARMRFFLDKIQELQLTSSIRDKFLSTDQGMCNQTQGGVNEYQFTEKAKKEYTPNSSMSHTIASIHSSNRQKIVKLERSVLTTVERETSFCIIDAQSVKNTDTAEEKGYDTGKKISGIKRHIAVDTQGLPHAIHITTAEATDRSSAVKMVKNAKANLSEVKNILVDAGYTGENFATQIKKTIGATVEVIKRSELHTFVVLPKRWVVERSFAWLEKFDTQGLPHAIHITTAEATDRSSAVKMVKNAKANLSEVKNILVDAGYTGENFATQIKDYRCNR
ncbi:uncharacterized protein TNIN_55701 [Trichonephila inaurata madagascariensis]|uniref:Transposase n=1 Tax=Trichonephila inaurata madagascariensis TaxID=2747483 RepID=A0A8X6YYM7_9ARAC|nr:uncharacterized protein TNIN_55701 [Trichonephila inaurata madagascariensis]